ncbi:hypothetical protein RJ640_029137 [Escallonia rubra]|uniref:Uncharacterized protein n=1 Tax=Escallonia rubra TaxID=112253 RepID=A0AA88R2W4_9ASTE|nr:hypothetical protein RJ640_029137 [Escallonia rubra]
MGWAHPDISLEDLLTLIKGFVDILILASGHQSSGQYAQWDAQNIKKAFQWGLFFEDVFRSLSRYDDPLDAIKELDATILTMTSSPYFPQGLAHISSTTLSNARIFIMEHLIHTLPLSDTHLRSVIEATIETDFEELQRTESNCLRVYLDQLMLHSTSLDAISDGRGLTGNSGIPYPNDVRNRKLESCSDGNFTQFAIQELMRRQVAVSEISSAESGLAILSTIIRQGNWIKLDNGSHEEHARKATAAIYMSDEGVLDGLSARKLLRYHLPYFIAALVLLICLVPSVLHILATSSRDKGHLVESVIWNRWRTRSLTYLLDKRTIRLVSGANIVFSAPKSQWLQVFERLNITAKSSEDNLCETLELLLLGCIASRWPTSLEQFMSVRYGFLTISKVYNDVRNLVLGRTQAYYREDEFIDPKERVVLKHLEVTLSDRIHQLWKLSPTLAAIAIPSWYTFLSLVKLQNPIVQVTVDEVFDGLGEVSFYLTRYVLMLDSVIGRRQQIVLVAQILGEPGVGKTGTPKGLAERIADGNIPQSIEGREVEYHF